MSAIVHYFISQPWWVYVGATPMLLAYLVPIFAGVDLKHIILLGLSVQVFVLTVASLFGNSK